MVDKRTLPPLVVIVGETASGKSMLAVDLAKKFNGEIICADSRTIYSGMDIGTAKPTKKDQAKIPHHLLNIIKPDDKYSAADFKEDTGELIEEIWWNNKLPIMAGGTGLYIDSVIFDYQFTTADAERDPTNPRHVLRGEVLKKDQHLRPNTLIIGLKIEKDELEQKITKRVEHMLQNGLVDEAKALINKYGNNCEALQGVGYRSILKYLDQEVSLEEMRELIIRDHMQLAKKQRTWFKRNKYIHWIDNPEAAFTLVQTFLSQSEH